MSQTYLKDTKNILVTGANGQLGQCIKDLEEQQDYLSFFFTSSLDLDITNLNQVQQFFQENDIDYCINCAAYTAVDKAETEKEEAFNVNVTGAKNLAIACQANQVVLMHISTDFVFDGNKTEPYTEEDKPNPISFYGASKLQGEIEIQKILKEHFIIRTCWLYSEYGHNFVKTMLRLAETRDEISVVNDQIGSPTYAGDLAEVIIKIIQSNSKDYGIYHFSNEGEISWYDFAKAIFEVSKKAVKVIPIRTTEYPTAAKRPNYSVLDKTKLKTTLNFEGSNWKDSLSKSIRLIKKNES